MYTEEELEALGIEEDELTEEEVLLLLAAVHSTLSSLEDELRRFYSKYGEDGVVSYSDVKKWVSSKNHIKRSVLLNQIIISAFDVGFKEFQEIFTNHLEGIVLKESQFFGVNLDIDDILNTPWGTDNLTYLQRLSNHYDKWTTILANDAKLSILKQDSILDVVQQALKRGESIKTTLKRLLRTEANAVSSLSRKQVYKTISVKKYKFIHNDGCNCKTCTDMDGQIFPLSEYEVGVTANPLHPNCRDYTIPVFD